MSEPTLQELKELIVDISKQVNELDKKMEVGFAKIEGEIKRVEETLSAKVDGLDKRLSNEETISRTAFGALMVASLAGLVKYLFFSQV
jgi:glycerol kinase